MHPHLLAQSLSPGTWCCPQTLGWAGRRGSCNNELTGGGTETQPYCPLGGAGRLKGAMLWPQWVQTEVSAVYIQEGGRGDPPALGCVWDQKEGSTGGIIMPGAGSRPAMPPEQGTASWGKNRLLLGAANDGENVQEDVDDVCVQVQCCKHVLLRAQGQLLVPQQQLCVHCQELGTTAQWC